MDIATYDHNELSARAGGGAWAVEAAFAPVVFDSVGFTARLSHIGQIRGLLAGMHGRQRGGYFAEELGGLTDDDLGRLARAAGLYLRWYRTMFPDRTVPMPLGDLLAQYVAFTKLQGIAGRGRVLEVGSGYGLMSLFVADDPQVARYDLIEVTQALYVIQASIAAFRFGEAFRNAALDADADIAAGTRARPGTALHAAQPFSIGMERAFRCSLFPWWRVDDPLSRQVDVIMSNANLVEMSAPSLDYYLQQWQGSLADDGFVLVQDLGNPAHRTHDDVLRSIDAAGFRALAKVKGRHGAKHFACWNLLLVTGRHPDYARAGSVLEPQVLVADHGTVRRAFGLDRPAGARMSDREILAQVSARLAAAAGGATRPDGRGDAAGRVRR